MSDQPDMNAAIAALLQQQMAAANPSAAWGAPQAAPTPTGVLVPLEIETPAGKVTVNLQFGPEFAAPAALMGLLQSLASQGMPLKAYQPRQDGGGWGNRGGNGGGWGNRGGGGNGGGWNGGNRGGWR